MRCPYRPFALGIQRKCLGSTGEVLRESRRICLPEVLAKPRAWEGQRPRCPRFAAVRATRTFPLPGFCECLYKRRRINENMVWTDSQDYDADEILYTARSLLFDKTNRLMRKIIILFEVYPRLFLMIISLFFLGSPRILSPRIPKARRSRAAQPMKSPLLVMLIDSIITKRPLRRRRGGR